MPRREVQWLRIKTGDRPQKIADFLLGAYVNTFAYPQIDKNGKPYISLGWDRKPDSDWGKYEGTTHIIQFADMDMANRGVEIVKKCLKRENA